jgi:hypothetical protein
MRVLENNYGWNPIETAPLDKGVTLEVTDGRGTPYRLPNPCRRTASAWVSSSKGTPQAVTPVRWKPYLAGGWKSRRSRALCLPRRAVARHLSDPTPLERVNPAKSP